jgi:hypothetical protein
MTKGLQNDFPNEPLAFLDQKGLSVGKTSFFFHQHQPPTTTMNCIIPKEGKSGRPQQATQSQLLNQSGSTHSKYQVLKNVDEDGIRVVSASSSPLLSDPDELWRFIQLPLPLSHL